MANTAGFTGPMTKAGLAAKGFGVAVAIGLGASLAEAIKFESAMAGVAKTVDATASEMAVLERGIIDMANRMPATREEIAGVAEAAGQLGIDKAHLLEFTEVAVNLGVTTNLAAADAATGLAKIANVMGTSEQDFDRLGATLVELGNNGASTESDILAMAQRLAGIGNLIGASEADVLALANAMSSVGIEAHLGGGATQRVFQIIYEAVKEGGSSLTNFATVAGESAESFAAAWERDPVMAYQQLIQGLSGVETQGGNVSAVLDDLGIKGTHNRQVILRLMGAHEVLAQSIDDGRRAWWENSALTEEAAKRYETAAARLETFRNQVTSVGLVVGAKLIPPLLDGVRTLQDFGRHLRDVGGVVSDAIRYLYGTGRNTSPLLDDLRELGGLGPVVADIAPALVNVFRVLEDGAEAAEPLVEGVLALGGSAVVGGLTGLAGGLESVGGFLARNELLIQAAVAATATWATLQAWGLIVAAYRAIEVRAWAAAAAVTQSGMVASLGQIARGVGQVAVALITLPAATNMNALAAGLGTVRMGLAGVLSAINPVTLGIFATVGAFMIFQQRAAEAKAEAQRFAAEIDAVAEAGVNSAEDLEEAFNERLAKSLAGVSGGFEGIGRSLNTALEESGVSVEELLRVVRSSNSVTGEMVALAGRLGFYAEGAGDEFYGLHTAWVESERQAGVLARRQRELGVETEAAADSAADGTEEQRALAEATGRTVEEIIAEDEALQELAESMRETWAAAFDLGSEFSGRMTFDEVTEGVADLSAGIARSVSDIRAELVDASAEISESLTDTIADIDEGLAKTDRDIGRSLTKSLGDIDEDLTDTVEDIREEMARARFELSGEELAEALARGEERIADATESAAERRADAQESAAERRAEAEEQAREREAEAIEEAEERRAQAVEESARRETEARERGMESINDYWAQNGVTGAQIEEFYVEQTAKVTEFASNIARAFELGYDPRLISDLLQQGPDEAAPIVEALVDDHSATLLWTVNAGVEAMRNLSDEAIEIARLTNKATGDMSDDAARELDTAIEIGRRKTTLGTRATAAAIAEEMGIGVDKVEWVAAEYDIALTGAVNPILEALGQPRIVGRGDTGVRIPGAGFAFNAGGRIPGPNVNRDIVPAMLTPDEHVITQQRAREWGHAFFDAINSGKITPGDIMAAGYNQGGRVTGDLQGLHPVLMSRLQAWAAATGDTYNVGSGYRSIAEQQRLYDRWMRRVPGQAPAAAPGSSMHNFGLASDGNHWRDRSPEAFGLRFPMSYEPWHVEPIEAKKLRAGAAPTAHGVFFEPLPLPPEIGEGLLADVGERVMRHAHDVATWWATEQTMSPTLPSLGPIAAGSIKAMVQQLAADKYGWTGPQWSALHELVQRESSWNPNAQNPTSTAYGLFQFLNSTWGAYGFTKTSDAMMQAVAGLHYIDERYGNPAAALAFHDRNNWYNLGGRVMPYGGYLHPEPWDTPGAFHDAPPGLNAFWNGTGRVETFQAQPAPLDRMAADATRALQVQVKVENHTHVHVGNSELGHYIDGRALTAAETVVEQVYEVEERVTRAGVLHG